MRFLTRLKTVSRWLDGDLSPTQARRVETRIRRNASLRREVDWLERMDPAMRPSRSLPGDFTERLIDALPALTPKEAPGCAVMEAMTEGPALARGGDGDESVAILPGMVLRPEETLTLGKAVRARLSLTDGSEVYLNDGTEVQLRPPKAGLLVRAGEAFLRMKRQTSDFTVQTPTAYLTVLGTTFDAEVLDAGRTRLTVLRGAVEFLNRAGRAVAVAGDEIEADDATPPEVKKAPSPGQRIAWAKSLDKGRRTSMTRRLLLMVPLLLVFGAAGWLGYRSYSESAGSETIPAAETVDPLEAVGGLSGAAIQKVVQWNQAAARRLADASVQGLVCTHAMVLAPNGDNKYLLMMSVRNRSGAPISGEAPLGISDYDPALRVYDSSGSELGVRWEGDMIVGKTARLFVTLNTPWEPGESMTILGATPRDRIGNRWGNRFRVVMQNNMGAGGVQQFALVLPSGYGVENTSTVSAASEMIDGRLVTLWEFPRKEGSGMNQVEAMAAPMKLNEAGSPIISQLSATDAEAFKDTMFPVALIHDVQKINDALRTKTPDAIFVNTQLYVLDGQGRLWAGHIRDATERDQGVRGVPVEVEDPDAEGGVARVFLSRDPKGFLSAILGEVFFTHVDTDDSIRRFRFRQLGDGRYSLDMNNFPGAEAVETFCLYIPSSATLEQVSAPAETEEGVGAFARYTWTKHLPKGMYRHSVEVVVKLQ